MYYVMSAEVVDGHAKPSIHDVCQTEGEAQAAVARVVRELDITDEDGVLIRPGMNDGDKWADIRFDEDGLTAWKTSKDENVCVMARQAWGL